MIHYSTDPRLLILTTLYLVVLIYAGYIDLKTYKIPDHVHVAIIFLGMAGMRTEYLWSAIQGLFVVSVPMLLLSLLGKNAMGGGDIKFMAANGFFMGATTIIPAAGIGLFVSLVLTTIIHLIKHQNLNTPFALGPYLSLGCATAWLFTRIITL